MSKVELRGKALEAHASRGELVGHWGWCWDELGLGVLSLQKWLHLLLNLLLNLLLHLLLNLLLDHLLNIVLHVHANLVLQIDLELLLNLLIDHFLDLVLHGTLDHLHCQLLGTLILTFDLLLKLLLGKHSHSLVDPEEALQAVLVVVDHILISVFFDRELLTEGKVDFLDFFLEVSNHFTKELFNLGHDHGAHGLSELGHHDSLYIVFGQVVAFRIEFLEVIGLQHVLEQ